MVANSKNSERIVQAALALFQRDDYNLIQVNDICQSAGVSRSSFYSVFTGKDDILLHILRGYKDDFEGTMRQLLHTESDLEKLWVLYVKYLSLAEEFGPALTGALFSLELSGKLSMTKAVEEYMSRYMEWFVRFVADCQRSGIIRNHGAPKDLIPAGVKLTFFIVFEWCVAKGAFPLRERAFEAVEDFYDIAPEHRGIRPE